ncbi:hypothetical protein RvY_04190 [Ramazzottius varieornatus]|uniref:Uncharacterized protein n=1 Tax=Ramazzottius varieornatus TaxID=947166 RepID=A0A1D1UQT4_RAMVA|nr:hypothetical protein RvY_04190 [Ramazzottius varieornatus]
MSRILLVLFLFASIIDFSHELPVSTGTEDESADSGQESPTGHIARCWEEQGPPPAGCYYVDGGSDDPLTCPMKCVDE